MCKGMDMAEATQDKLLECEDGRQCKACGEAQKYSENSLIDNAITSLDESCDTESSRRKRSGINLYSAGIFLYKPWRPKCFI